MEVWSAPSDEHVSPADWRHVWLRSMQDPELHFHMIVPDQEIVWKPIGSFSSGTPMSDQAYTAVNHKGSQSDEITIGMVAVGPADQYRIEQMYRNSHLMLLQLPQRQWFVRFSQQPEFKIMPWEPRGQEWYRGAFVFISVEPPDWTTDDAASL